MEPSSRWYIVTPSIAIARETASGRPIRVPGLIRVGLESGVIDGTIGASSILAGERNGGRRMSSRERLSESEQPGLESAASASYTKSATARGGGKLSFPVLRAMSANTPRASREPPGIPVTDDMSPSAMVRRKSLRMSMGSGSQAVRPLCCSGDGGVIDAAMG